MKKINFALETDEMLKKFLKYYCLVIPEDERGTFIRGEAVSILTNYQNMMATEEDRRVKVLFHRTGDSTVGEYVFIGLNGRAYQIPFDIEVVLPESVVRVVDDAVVTRYKESGKSTTGNVSYNSTEHRVHPYTLIEYMDEEGMVIPELKEKFQKESTTKSK